MKKFALSAIFLFVFSIIANTQNLDLPSTSSDGELNIQSTYHFGEKTLVKEEVVNIKSMELVDPGVYPEGDYMGRSAFTPDGQKVILTNRITNMVTIYEFSTMDVLANIELGLYPSCVAANDNYAIVGCQFSDSIFLIDLVSYDVAGGIPTGEQPCWIELSPGGDTAYVACDIDDVCIAIDIPSQTVLGQVDDFPIYLNVYSWAVQVNRGWEKYNGFIVMPQGDRIAIVNPETGIEFYTTDTYELLETVIIEAARAICLSGDGNYIICAANPDNTCRLYQVQDGNYQITAEVEVTGYGLGTSAVVANQAGNKAYIGTNNNTSTLVRFDSQDFITFSSTYTAFWLGVSHDHLYAVSGQNRFSIIDFENEIIADQHIGLNQSFGCVSPVAYHVFGYDPLRYEGAYFFDFTNPENIVYMGSQLSGAAPEGDTPGAIAISNDRETAVSINNLSYNASVFDLGLNQVDGSVDLLESCYDVKITPDGDWAVAGGYDENEIKIIDLSDNTLATTVYTGQRPMIVEMAPDGQYAYIGNIKNNRLSMVELDGAGSTQLVAKGCGVIGVYIPFFGIRSAVRVSPDGNTVLVTASFDDELNIFDTQAQDFVASLTTGDFPLDVAFNSDGTIACVVNTFDNTYDVASIDGASSSILFHNNLNCDYPVDVAYNEAEDLFYICSANSEKIFSIDPHNGEVVETIFTDGAPFHMEFWYGSMIVQYQGDNTYDHRIEVADAEFILPYAAAPFSLNHEAGMIGVPMPGPDMTAIIDLGPPPFINELDQDGMVNIYPNPASGRLYIRSGIEFNRIEILDIKGQAIISSSVISEQGLDISGIIPGNYIVRISSGKMIYHKQLVIY